MKNRNRIRKAVKRPGAFKKYCGGDVTEDCIDRGEKSSDATTRKRASLAKTLRRLRNRK